MNDQKNQSSKLQWTLFWRIGTDKELEQLALIISAELSIASNHLWCTALLATGEVCNLSRMSTEIFSSPELAWNMKL